MRRAGGTAAAALAAALCVTVLGGCRGHAAGSQSVGNPPAPTATTAAPDATGAAAGDNAPSDAGVDSDLNAVDGQLSGLDSALAQATASPSDGG